MKKKRILLADDHKFIIEGLKNILEPKYEIAGIVEDGKTLVEKAEILKPDAIVVDISMPLLNGIEAVRQIKKKNIPAKIIFLTMHPDITYATRALETGALGFVLKHSAPAELITAIEKALCDEIYVTPTIAEELETSPHSRKSPLRKLTPRQREVLQLLAEGKQAKEVAEILYLSPRTVEFHKYRIMEELGVKSSAELVHFAIKHGIITI